MVVSQTDDLGLAAFLASADHEQTPETTVASPAAPDSEDPVAEAHRLTARAMQLLQTHLAGSGRLAVVTRGATEPSPDLAAATVWGLPEPHRPSTPAACTSWTWTATPSRYGSCPRAPPQASPNSLCAKEC
ncbi:hypothetical protein ACRAWF_22260 [Streptomyces sp. L7]